MPDVRVKILGTEQTFKDIPYSGETSRESLKEGFLGTFAGIISRLDGDRKDAVTAEDIKNLKTHLEEQAESAENSPLESAVYKQLLEYFDEGLEYADKAFNSYYEEIGAQNSQAIAEYKKQTQNQTQNQAQDQNQTQDQDQDQNQNQPQPQPQAQKQNPVWVSNLVDQKTLSDIEAGANEAQKSEEQKSEEKAAPREEYDNSEYIAAMEAYAAEKEAAKLAAQKPEPIDLNSDDALKNAGIMAQTKLAAAGFAVGKIDGIIGPNSRAGLQKFLETDLGKASGLNAQSSAEDIVAFVNSSDDFKQLIDDNISDMARTVRDGGSLDFNTSIAVQLELKSRGVDDLQIDGLIPKIRQDGTEGHSFALLERIETLNSEVVQLEHKAPSHQEIATSIAQGVVAAQEKEAAEQQAQFEENKKIASKIDLKGDFSYAANAELIERSKLQQDFKNAHDNTQPEQEPQISQEQMVALNLGAPLAMKII